jgi:hypothetical protein
VRRRRNQHRYGENRGSDKRIVSTCVAGGNAGTEDHRRCMAERMKIHDLGHEL